MYGGAADPVHMCKVIVMDGDRAQHSDAAHSEPERVCGAHGLPRAPWWTRALERLGVTHRPFTQQENNVVKTCAVSCYTITFGGGFGSTLLGMDKKM
ncbi:unnamed protein product [Urochloa humidicola]